MRFLKYTFSAIILFVGLLIGFIEIEASESDELDEPAEEVGEGLDEVEATLDREVEESLNEIEDTVDEEVETDEQIHMPKDDKKDKDKNKEDNESEQVEDEKSETELNAEDSKGDEKDNLSEVLQEEQNNEEIQKEKKVEAATYSTQVTATMPYQSGDRHDDLVFIKQMLNDIGYDRISETNYFGSWTKTRVQQFQKDFNLSVTGEIDQSTLNKITAIYESPFRLGKRHDSTIELKQTLNSLGYGYITVTSLYGDWTENRVKKFQRDHGLNDHGVADDETWAKLNQLLENTEFQVGDRHPNIIPIKEKLNAISFNNISETDYFGNWMETRVKQFQSYYGLSVTGTTNSATIEKLDEVYNSPFQLGKRHDSTIELKEKLNHLGYGHISVTNLYGDWTVNRVKKFQRENGLRESGIADSKTWNKLNEVLEQTNFSVGDRHPNIIPIKEKLNAIGFNNISETNYYGSWTETRVKQFQSYYGLSVTGTTNNATINKLNEIYNSPFQLGERHQNTIELKEKLNRIGYGYISLTNLYGSFTEQQVRKLQNHHGLRVNGIADEVTQKKINDIYNSPLQKGKSNSQVVDLKQDLNALGYNGISITNYFGSWTETRLKQFQRDNNLPVSGIADQLTLMKIEEQSKIRIFIDPGHGAHDSGGTGYGLLEKNVVLDIGLSLRNHLKGYKNVEVILSRSTDEFLELHERTNLANSLGADYFVSLHVNAHNGSSNGFESFIFNGPVSQETKDRQRDLHTHLANWLRSNNGIDDRGMKRANFAVLRGSTMPAILLEYMFIDNRRENNLLRSKSYRNQLGKVTADAIAKSFNLKK